MKVMIITSSPNKDGLTAACGNGYLQDKPVIAVAAAVGSGNGAISCLASMERLLMHLTII